MKQKSLLAIAGLVLGVLAVGCGGKYSDLKEVNQEFVELMSAYVDALADVGSAADAAKAINKLADGMEKVAPKMKAMREKYPELQDPEKMPEEIKMNEKEVETIGRKFGESFMKLMPYMEDQGVQNAQMRLSSIMRSMGPER